MHRIDTTTAQKDKFGAGKNGFTRGNPQTGTPATDLDDDYFDAIQEELAGIVEATGVALDKSKRNQVLTALKALLLSRVHPFADIKADGAAAVAEALSNLGFVGSLTSPGYAVIPLGTKKLVIQWGTVTVPTAGSASATYLLALDLGLAQFCTPIDVSSINNYRVGVATSTKTSITLASTNTQSVTGVMWLSIGTIN
ncbi:gp53-like domain-containing protein [Enterobacter roggenkampii]|uniref:gp53-like domain-containing protein n=1 Tax=Enterobacter roggenkampii TaxID=1812935 RepID=UPI003D23CBFC